MTKHKILTSCCSILLATILVACNSETSLSTGIDVESAKQMIVSENDVVVLDVRTPKEFARGHIAGAININIHDATFPQYVSTLDRDKIYIVHCAVNPRKGRGDKSINIMTKLGFQNLLSMDGGINAWKRAGLPIDNS